jgi:hypothetical protein
MIRTARVAQRKLYHHGLSEEQTGKGQRMFMRVFHKRHPNYVHPKFLIIK